MFSIVTRYDSVIHNFATDFAKVISHYVIGRAEPSTIYLRINDVQPLFSPCEWNALQTDKHADLEGAVGRGNHGSGKYGEFRIFVT